MKRIAIIMGMTLSVLVFPIGASAAGTVPSSVGSTETEMISETESSEGATETDPASGTSEEDNTGAKDIASEIINNTNKPFLALGKDLNEEQLEYVLNEMGISKDDLNDYRVIYITNDEEHKYLDQYIDPAVIGNVSLSSVMVKENVEGYGIRVTTKNINYCTVSMYKNALLTAGVKNADVYVVGPYSISGTAALIGAWQAYEEMTGEELEEEAKTAALAEMITVGDITDEQGNVDGEKVEELIEYIKAEVIANGLDDAKDIKEVIENAEKKFDIALTEEQKEQLVDVMGKIADLDIDPTVLLEQAGDIYDKYGETILANAKDTINGIFTEEVKKSLWESIVNFFKTLFDAVKDYFMSK